jgi:serine/threonine protein phosphatase 1
MKRTFAIGDIHGCPRTFSKLVTEMIIPGPEDEIICVGDYIDRGPDSKGVIDSIIALKRRGCRIRTLRGNHEQLLLDALEDKEAFDQWLMCGGDKTCNSFGIHEVSQLPDEYLSFFKQTEYYHATDQMIIVHAGLNFESDDPFADTDAMLWTRNTFVDLEKSGGRKIIHGHTPTPLQRIYSLRHTNSINIDGGCVMTHLEGLGYLVAIRLETLELLAVRNCD